MSTVALMLVITGLVGLCLSLPPILMICRHHRSLTWGWNALAAMVAMFILGYLFYAVHLLSSNHGIADLILSLILFGGGGFVLLVSLVSRSTLEKMDVIASSFEQQALHDNLTGLPNRKFLYLTLDNTIAARGRSTDSFAVMIMDLDGFKEINDTLGHQAGDTALRAIAPRFQRQLRGTDTLCRLGGDEFAIVLPQANEEQAHAVAKKLIQSCEEPLNIENQKVFIGVSIGISVCPDHATLTDQLLQYADVAMYLAKRNHTGIQTYHTAIDKSSRDKLGEPQALRESVKQGGVKVRFQPVMRDQSIHALEAHCYWVASTGDERDGQYVFELAEKAGFIADTNQAYIEKAIAGFLKAKELLELDVAKQPQGDQSQPKTVRLHLPVFRQCFREIDFLTIVKKCLEKNQLHLNDVTLMLSEISMWNQGKLVHKPQKYLNHSEFSFGISQFGSTGGSILLLQSLPVKIAKMDPLFCKRLLKDESNFAVLKAAIVLLKNLNIRLIIDGVPDEATLRLIEQYDVDGFQGIGVEESMSVEAKAAWLKALA